VVAHLDAALLEDGQRGVVDAAARLGAPQGQVCPLCCAPHDHPLGTSLGITASGILASEVRRGESGRE